MVSWMKRMPRLVRSSFTRVVDHLAQQEDPFAGILLQGLVADLDGILHPVAEAEMPGEDEAHRTQVKQGGREVLLLGVLRLAESLQAPDEVAAVVGGDGEAAQAGGLSEDGGCGKRDPLGRPDCGHARTTRRILNAKGTGPVPEGSLSLPHIATSSSSQHLPIF
jgi:hypothetical protein